MNKVNVLIVSKFLLGPGYLDKIAVVDPGISVRDATELFVAELHRKGVKGHFTRGLEEAILENTPPQPPDPRDLDTLLAEAEVIFGAVIIPDNMATRAPRLKWVHFGNVGLDHYHAAGLETANVLMTNCAGTMDIGIAEHVLACAMALAKSFPRLFLNQQKRSYERIASTVELRDRVMGVIGLGNIGGEVAKLAKGIGMKVIGIRRSVTSRQSNSDGVDEVYPAADLLEVLSKSDFVAITVPLTPETNGMIGEAQLRAMKPGAFLINVARGQIVNETALIKALKERWIAGAGLDVFEVEPLPRESELWSLPNVILSPHISAHTDRRAERIIDIFCENLRRYLDGKPLLNLVDLKRGY